MWNFCCDKEDPAQVDILQVHTVRSTTQETLMGRTSQSGQMATDLGRTNQKKRLRVASENAYEVHVPCSEHDSLGLICDALDETVCIVAQVEDGLISRWNESNQSSPAGTVVQRGHRLLLVDGQPGRSSEFVAELKFRAKPVS